MAKPSSYPLRISEELRTRLEVAAVDANRSFNAELSLRLALTVTIEDLFSIPMDQLVPHLTAAAITGEKYAGIELENETLKKKLQTLQSEFTAAFAVSGEGRAGVALMKLKKAQAHITSGLKELQSLIPEEGNHHD